MRYARYSVTVVLFPFVATIATTSVHAFAPPSPTSSAIAARGRLKYVRHADELSWLQQRATEEGADYEERVNARYSRYRRRERLRRGRVAPAPAHRDAAVSYGAEMDRQRRELLRLEERQQPQPHERLEFDGYRERTTTRGGRGTTPMLVNTPIPIVNSRTNSDFPASELPATRWSQLARPPVPFEEASYSECARARTRVLVPCDDGSAADDSDGEERVDAVLDGRNYAVRTIEDVILPGGRPERGYWLRTKIYDAIYGQVRCGTVLRRLDPLVRVRLPPPSPSSPSPAEEWASVEWIASTAESVAIKEMSWEHIRAQRSELAEDPIKEVAAMQHLQRWADDDRERRANTGASRRRRIPDGESSSPEDDYSTSQNTIQQSHIMMPMDLLSDKYNLYSITPFCTGGRLLDMVESKSRFSEPEARYWMRQILKGLSCLKKAGVCHRDMSPENLMVHEGNVYIIDMGMCLRIPDNGDDGSFPTKQQQRQRRSLILPQSACGKWYYLSPEVCESEQPFDGPAVDLWAAGVILFIMLTGVPAWKEPKMTDENFKLMSAGHLVSVLTERRAGLSADAMDLLQRMFWLDPADRLSLEQVMAHPWMTHKHNLPPNDGR